MPRFRNRPFLSHGPLLFVIPSAAERICGAPFVGPAPTGLQPSHPPNPPGNINLAFVIPGFQEYSVEPQIRSAALGMTKRRGPWARKGRLLDERAVAEPRNCLNPIWAADDLHPTRIYSAKRASKQSTSYILKKPVAPLIWTALTRYRPSPGAYSLHRPPLPSQSRQPPQLAIGHGAGHHEMRKGYFLVKDWRFYWSFWHTQLLNATFIRC